MLKKVTQVTAVFGGLRRPETHIKWRHQTRMTELFKNIFCGIFRGTFTVLELNLDFLLSRVSQNHNLFQDDETFSIETVLACCKRFVIAIDCTTVVLVDSRVEGNDKIYKKNSDIFLAIINIL